MQADGERTYQVQIMEDSGQATIRSKKQLRGEIIQELQQRGQFLADRARTAEDHFKRATTKASRLVVPTRRSMLRSAWRNLSWMPSVPRRSSMRTDRASTATENRGESTIERIVNELKKSVDEATRPRGFKFNLRSTEVRNAEALLCR